MPSTTENLNNNSTKNIINIDTPPEEHSRETLAFQKKIKKIEKLESSNKKLQEDLQSIQIEVMELADPVIKKICKERVKNLRILETQFELSFFRKNEKEKIRQLILGAAYELYDTYSDTSVKEIIDKFSALEEDDNDLLEDDIEDEIDDIIEDLFGQFASESENSFSEKPTKSKKRKTNVHQEKVNLESKAIYRDLMKKLHPDLELDEGKKNEKNEATQKVVEAYKSNNIYELLKLRAEHLDQSISDHDIKLYATELNKRIRELEYEKFCIKGQFRDTYDHFYSRSKKKTREIIQHEYQKPL